MLPHTCGEAQKVLDNKYEACCAVNIIQELRLTCQLDILKIILGWKVVSTWSRNATFWKLPYLHCHPVMMQVSKTPGCCSELMQLVAREDQYCKSGRFSYSLLWYDYSVQRKQVSGIQFGKVYTILIVILTLLSFSFPVCVNVTYLVHDYGMSFTVTVNKHTIFNETVSGKYIFRCVCACVCVCVLKICNL